MSGKKKLNRYRIVFELVKNRKLDKDELRNILSGITEDDDAIEFLKINFIRKETVKEV